MSNLTRKFIITAYKSWLKIGMLTDLGEAGPPLALEKVDDVGERMDTVSGGATFNGDCRSSGPDIPISRPETMPRI